MVEAAAELVVKAAVHDRQLEAENKKNGGGGGGGGGAKGGSESAKAKDLRERVEALRDSTASLDAVINKAFDGVWVLRVKDIDGDLLRAQSIQALGRWIVEYPGMLLDDTKLKYFGWALSDPELAVRKATFTTLQAIYKACFDEENSSGDDALDQNKLTNFTARFVQRSSPSVSTASVGTVPAATASPTGTASALPLALATA